MASNRLPVNIAERGGKLRLDRSIGGVATALDAIFKKYNAFWVGWMGVRRILSDNELENLRLPKHMVPVQAEEPLVEAYYDHLTNRVLWPTFHDIAPHYQATAEDWEGLREIARRFAAAIARIVRADDVIWVHDYHLILLPAALRALGVINRIGYFWHTPFPSREFMLTLPHHQELFESLAHLDLLGLQTEKDVAKYHACLEDLPAAPVSAQVKAFPIGIDFASYHAAIQQREIAQRCQEIRQAHAGQRIILSISRLDYTKGIPSQIDAVAHFYESLPPAQRRQFRYKLVVAPSREDVVEYRQLHEKVEHMVAEVNDRLRDGDWEPIEYIYKNFGFEDMVAWYSSADVLLLLPCIDGMNLISKEYIATKQDGDCVLVLSSNTGSAQQLKDALLVDPYDPAGVAKTLHQALAMPRAERVQRWNRMIASVRDENVFWWANNFLESLKQ